MKFSYVTQEQVGEIIVYHFHQSHRRAVDEYLDHMGSPLLKERVDAGLIDTPIRIVVDLSESGMFPVNYMAGRVRDMFDQYEKVPTYYIAYIIKDTSDSVMVKLIEGMTTGYMSHTRHMFTHDQFDQAISWLEDLE